MSNAAPYETQRFLGLEKEPVKVVRSGMMAIISSEHWLGRCSNMLMENSPAIKATLFKVEVE